MLLPSPQPWRVAPLGFSPLSAVAWAATAAVSGSFGYRQVHVGLVERRLERCLCRFGCRLGRLQLPPWAVSAAVRACRATRAISSATPLAVLAVSRSISAVPWAATAAAWAATATVLGRFGIHLRLLRRGQIGLEHVHLLLQVTLHAVVVTTTTTASENQGGKPKEQQT